jgi:hypothetical protein
MSYFYADGTDKSGNRLLTSYGKEAQARKYRADAKITQGERFLAIAEDGTAKLSTSNDGKGLLVRTLMINSNPDADNSGGKFVVWARIDGKWEPTNFRYSTYAKANAAVKSALINLYPACAVIESSDTPVQTSRVPMAEDAVL